MAASADLLMTGGPRRTELWLDVALSILLHALLVTLVFLTPHFQIGRYITVPVTYQVDLVSATPGSKSGAASSPASASPAAPAVRPAPAPRTSSPYPARFSEPSILYFSNKDLSRQYLRAAFLPIYIPKLWNS